ncbi:MAG: hypothetical protein U1E05_14090 [Patescibacteria group bacterium]|nr:hypothetical protein [Patescibacteria group bacterium]
MTYAFHTPVRGPRYLIGATLLGIAAIVGCWGRGYDGDPRASLEGAVSLGGAPVDGGVIQFEPTSGTGRKASAPITAGRYEIPEAQGPNLGPHRVKINWLKPTGQQSDDGEGMTTAEAIPPEYHAESTLEVEVKAGRNAHNFEL